MKLIISLLVYNQLEVTLRCIDSILKNTVEQDFLLIISDNASNKYVGKRLKQISHKKVRYIRNSENIGFILAHNNIFKKYPSDFFCVLNNDLVIKTYGWDAKFIQVLEEDKNIAQVGNQQEFGYIGSNGVGQPRKGKPLDYISGSSFIVRSKYINQMGSGLFEENYMHFAFCEDADLSLRLRSNGYKIAECTDVEIDHLHNWSFKHEKVDVDFKQLEKKNNAFLLDRWSNYFKYRIFKPIRILVDRQGALGDALCTEPIIKALRKKYPLCLLHVNTVCPTAFTCNRYVDHCANNLNKKDYDIVIDLNLAYEKNPTMHIVDAYAKEAGVILDQSNKIPVYYGLTCFENKYENSDYITVCSEGSWLSRTWNLDRWKSFISRLSKTNKIVEVGHDKRNYLGIGENLIGKMSLQQTVGVIAKAKLFVGFDGGLMHFSQAVGTPVFIIFGCTNPLYRIHDWNKATVVNMTEDELECAGCHHKLPAPRCFTECTKDKIYCLDGISLERVINTFNRRKV